MVLDEDLRLTIPARACVFGKAPGLHPALKLDSFAFDRPCFSSVHIHSL